MMENGKGYTEVFEKKSFSLGGNLVVSVSDL